MVNEDKYKYNFGDLQPATETYHAFIDDNRLRAEFDLWKQRCTVISEDRPQSASDAFTACDASLYPNVAILLQILVTLPVTTATAERAVLHSFTLKRLQTYLRSAIGENRLTSLALLNIHAETTAVDAENVIDKFAFPGPHKSNFLR